MRILVCGGRRYDDRTKVFDVLDTLNYRTPITVVLQGGASGADSLARDWADERGIEVQTYVSGTTQDGRASWSRGNQWMLDEGRPNLVVAFPGVRRTADMVLRAKSAGVTVIEVFR